MKKDLTTSEAKQKAAIEYFHKHREPDQSICPELLQYFRSTRGTIIYSSKTGRRTQRNDMDTRHAWKTPCLVPVRNSYNGLYVRYVEDLDALELSHICLCGNRGTDGVKRDWWFPAYGRNLVFRNDVNCYSDFGFKAGKMYYCKWLISFICGINLCLVSQKAYDELKKFTHGAPIDTKWGNQEWPRSWQYAQWYQDSFISRQQSKTSKDLLAYELAPIELTRKQFGQTQTVTVFERLDDNYAVLRMIKDCSMSYNWKSHAYEYGATPDCREQMRIFISAKGKPTVMTFHGEWAIKSAIGYGSPTKFAILNYTEALTWNPLKYTVPFLSELTVSNLLAVLRHPIIEQLIKAGYPNTARCLLDNGEVCANMKKWFGVDKERKLPIYKLLGVNKYLLREYERRWDEHNNYSLMIADFKKLYDKFDISDLDEATVKMICAGYTSEAYPQLHRWVTGGNYWGREFDVTDVDRKVILKLFRMASDHPGILGIWADILSTYRSINNKPDMDLTHFKSEADLTRMHDALVEVRNVEVMERNARWNAAEKERMAAYQKDFEKRQEGRIEKFEYETDDDAFVIRVPHELSDITREGAVLGHCVGGYVNRHASGETNIVFLRHKENENLPFYTIEIKNDRVIQIHGRYNRWLGNNPEAIPFMYRYLKDHGFRFDKNMLLNKGSGYSPSAEMLPETALFDVSA